MKTKISLLLMLFFSFSAFAQQMDINGVVTSKSDGLPLPGVNIIVKGTSRGTTSDFDGKYSISVSKGDQLEYSYLGFKTMVITVENQTIIDVSLEDDTESLNEVVVIGYGTAKKRDLTGSIVSIDGDEVADKPATNPVASLQGKVSGLTVVNSGQVGQEPDIRIRGTSSRYNTKPLYVVDGIFADNIDFVNPNDIESIEVLKDASSLAIFGVRGANGVIIVTTKQAKEGKFTATVNSTIGVKNITGAPDLANAALFRELYDEGLVNMGQPAFTYYDLFTGNTDWVDEISNKSSLIKTTNISFQNATERNKISFGLGYRTEDGLIKAEELQRLTANLNNEFKVTDNFKIGLTVNGLKDRLPNNGSFASALNATPIVDPFHFDSREDYPSVSYNQLPDEIGGPQIANPLLVAEVLKNKAIAEKYRFVGNVFAEINFLKDFTFKASIYGDMDNIRRRSYTPIVGIYASEIDEIVNLNGNNITRVNQSSTTAFNFQQEYLLSYKKEIGKHDFNVLAGYTTTQYHYENLSGSVQHDPDGTVGIIPDDERFWYVNVYPYGDPATRTSSSSQYERATSSFLGRALYSFDGKYLLNTSYRRDATSQLAPGNRAADFWSVGAGWIVTDESFMDGVDYLNNLKLKGSFGKLGNQNVPVNYPFYPGVNAGATAVFGGVDSNGDGYPDNDGQVYPGYLGRFEENPDLKWETVNLWEVGLESRWLENRLTFNMNYYNRKTEDLLVFVDTGTASFFDNFGEIENKGFEFELSWNDQIGEDFNYSVGGNLTTIKNTVLSTREDAAIFSGAASRTITGQPIGHFYGYVVDGIYQSNADIAENVPSALGAYAPGDFKYRDVNGDGEITEADRTIIGNPTPDFTYGIFANFSYKNFYLNMEFQGVYGNEIYRNWGNGSTFATFNYRSDRAGRWNGSGTSNWEPRIADTGYNTLPSTYMIEDGSYFRIRNVQLGYSLGSDLLDKIKVQQLKLFLSVQNLYTWKNNSGFTPEAGGSPIEFGVDSGGYPVPVISTLGVSLTF